MSRLFNPDDFEFREPGRDPKVVVKEETARLKTAVKAEKPIEMDVATRARLADVDRAQGFIVINDRLSISPTLAKMLHHRPADEVSGKSGELGPDDAEARSLDEARR